jgi:hypothetical protein
MAETFIPLSAITTRTGFTPGRQPVPPSIETSFFGPETNTKQAGEWLISQGLTSGAGTVQGDIAVATNIETGKQQGLCEKNCAPYIEDGVEKGFSCPIKRTDNPGINTSDLTPSNRIIQGFLVAAAGIESFNKRFVANGSLDRYCREFGIPPDIQKGMAFNLLNTSIIANIFGGNPEIHPEVIDIAKSLKKAGLRTTLTTTGGILLRKPPRGRQQVEKTEIFLKGIRNYVDVMAVSFDAASAEEVTTLTAKTKEDLQAMWQATPFLNGIRRKAFEAANVGNIMEQDPRNFPQLVFNLVVHPGNLPNIEEIIDAIKINYPHAKINPYPAQSAFSGEPPVFAPDHVPQLTSFITNRLAEQKAANPHMVLRPHYYAMLAAVVDTFRETPQTVARMLSGYDVWRCYERPYDINGAGHVVQFGATPHPLPQEQTRNAGGYLDCFWPPDPPTRNDEQIWNMGPAEVADYIDGGIHKAGKSVKNPCEGCLMPRLNGDLFGSELGLNKRLKHAYLKRREQTVGF